MYDGMAPTGTWKNKQQNKEQMFCTRWHKN